MFNEIILMILLFGTMYLCGWLIETIEKKRRKPEPYKPTLEDFFLESLTAQFSRVPGTGGMTLKEYYLHHKKSLATICEECQDPHSLRLTSQETLTCQECGHEQSTTLGQKMASVANDIYY